MQTGSKFPHRIEAFLKEVNCSYPLFPGGDLITISRNETFSGAMKIFLKHRILSVPVLDDEGRVVYLLSISDLIDCILSHIGDKELKGEELNRILEQKEDLSSKKIYDLGSMVALTEKPFSVFRDDKLLKAVLIMITKSARRVLVVNEEGKPQNLISESRIVQLLSMMSSTTKMKSLEQLQIHTKDVVTISKGDKALDAFKLMRQKGISALAVVNSDGSLFGTMSISDIKVIGDSLQYILLLNQTVEDYLNEIHKKTRYG
jgi:CBS domain-containing protein